MTFNISARHVTNFGWPRIDQYMLILVRALRELFCLKFTVTTADTILCHPIIIISRIKQFAYVLLAAQGIPTIL